MRVFNIIIPRLQPQLSVSNDLFRLYYDQYDSQSAYNNFNSTIMYKNIRFFLPNFYF